ncbi:MAG: tetratricopeptide repeat protein [Verrucomicrobiota bacterium]
MTGHLVLMITAFAALSAFASNPGKPPTFNRDIAPVIFGQCVECHHPGGYGPFSLASYEEVKKRAKLIAHVTASRYMPPWLPEPGHGEFIGARRLTNDQIALIGRWVKEGAPEGAAADLKTRPRWEEGWQLGKPDLVAVMPLPYTLSSEGRDVYRNFVIPRIVPAERYLRAVEFRPGTTGAVHHAFILFDDTGEARRRAAQQAEPGFAGMDAGEGAKMPDAMFLSWQPGKRAVEAPIGLSAVIGAGTDLVLQLHMRPTGKPEKIQASVALYFTDKPPRESAFRMMLRSVQIDIPAGISDYAIESAYRLPVDAKVLGVLPHLHYLGKEIHGWAELPDGRKEELIYIKEWDFNWQGDYRLVTPLLLPAGSLLRMRYTYDNSEANVRNPNQPPQRVVYGLQSTDEMGELGIQLLPRNPVDLEILARDYFQNWALPDTITRNKILLQADPKDAAIRTELAAALLVGGRVVEAKQQLRQALADDPRLARTHSVLSEVFIRQNDLSNAIAAGRRAVELDPADAKAQNNLGWMLLERGDVAAATPYLEQAVRMAPSDTLAIQNLKRARAMLSTTPRISGDLSADGAD